MDRMLRACLNWRVVVGLTGVGVGIWLVAPGLLIAALPILLIALCPLSMLLMMRGMGGHTASARDGETETASPPSREATIASLKADREAMDRRIAELEGVAERTEKPSPDPIRR